MRKQRMRQIPSAALFFNKTKPLQRSRQMGQTKPLLSPFFTLQSLLSLFIRSSAASAATIGKGWKSLEFFCGRSPLFICRISAASAASTTSRRKEPSCV